MNFAMTELTTELLLIGQDGIVLRADEISRKNIGLHRIKGRRLVDLLSAECRSRVEKSLHRAFNGENRIEELEFFTGTVSIVKLVRIELNDGTPAVAAIVFATTDSGDEWPTAADNGKSFGMLALSRGVAVQINRLKQQLSFVEAKYDAARQSVMIDQSTGIHNRAGLDYWLQKEVDSGGAEGTRLFLVYLDLDDFKRFNDTHGHMVGDKVLKVVARRLRASRKVICAARVGGDEFAIVARHAGDVEDLANGLDAILHRIFRSARIDGLLLRFSGSAGFSVYDQDALDITALKEHADTALVEAKRTGKRRVQHFDARLADRARRRSILERDLPQALESGSIRPVYQPIVPANAEHGFGVEVLSRWEHYEFGAVPPDEFIGLASETGLISELDIRIATIACRELAPLVRCGDLEFISLNISPSELIRNDHIEQLICVIGQSGLDPKSICVEVTESEFISDMQGASRAIERLRAAGISIALDDYGTGYSNLRALLDVPFETLKIDRSLVQTLATDERAMRIVLSVINLARVFNADLVAEGIETREQALVARAMGCQYLQGYAFSRPLDIAPLRIWILKQKRNQEFADIGTAQALRVSA